MDAWRLILDPPASGVYNMAVDEALLRAMEAGVEDETSPPPVLRLYSWLSPAVSVGYAQKAERLCSKAASEGLSIVRRISGGRAVLHASEITYSVICPSTNQLFNSGIDGAYRSVSRAITNSLKGFGINASFEKGVRRTRGVNREPLNNDACFFATSRYEVVVQGDDGIQKKIAGSSQRRFKNAFIQHGSILVDIDLALNESIFGLASLSRSSCVREHSDVDLDILKGALVESFAESLDADFFVSRLFPAEYELMLRLRDNKYSKLDWNEPASCGRQEPREHLIYS